jgi:hypothetical protein
VRATLGSAARSITPQTFAPVTIGAGGRDTTLHLLVVAASGPSDGEIALGANWTARHAQRRFPSRRPAYAALRRLAISSAWSGRAAFPL